MGCCTGLVGRQHISLMFCTMNYSSGPNEASTALKLIQILLLLKMIDGVMELICITIAVLQKQLQVPYKALCQKLV